MRLLTRFLLAIAIFNTNTVLAQELARPMTFGKVPPAELAMKSLDADTSANAVVLCNFAQANVETPPGSIQLRWEHHKRIKIFKKTGFSQANIAIPFYSHNKTEEFFFDKAMVHLPDGQQFKVNKKEVFIEKLNDYVSLAKFTFPKLEEGCVIEYTYFMNSTRVSELKEWYFQEAIPVLWSEIRVEFPPLLKYVFLFQGNDGMKITEEKENYIKYEGKNGTFLITPRRYVMQNAAAMKEEAFVTTMDDYLARIRFQLSEVNYPDGRKEKVMVDWKGLQAEIIISPVFGDQFLKKAKYKKLAETVLPLAAGLSSNLEKTQFFYKYLTENMEWNGRYSVFSRQMDLNDIFDTRKANSGELNMMLYLLLKESGISAYPVLTSTRQHGRMFEAYPFMDQFNHLVVLAAPDGNRLVMDATDPLRPIGYPSTQALNGRGLKLNPQGGEPAWMDITPPKDGADILIWDLKLDEEGTLAGSMYGVHKGYNAVGERRSFIEDSTGQHWQKRLAKRFTEVEIQKALTGNLKTTDKPFFDTLLFTLPNAAQVSGDLMYINPIIYSEFSESLFKLKERNYPVDIPYPFTEQLVLKMTIPPGYKVESLPELTNKSLPDAGGNFFFATEAKNDTTIQVTAKLNISKQKFTPLEYPALKELFDVLVEKYGEQVVLKKE